MRDDAADPSSLISYPSSLYNMVEIKILTRPECHLCDAAKFVVNKVARDFDAQVVEVDISTDAQLEADYGWDIPVIFVDGTEHARHRVSERPLRELLTTITSSRQ